MPLTKNDLTTVLMHNKQMTRILLHKHNQVNTLEQQTYENTYIGLYIQMKSYLAKQC